MLVTSIRMVNFRCFVDSGEIPLQKFSVLIGKNNGGKSSLIDALERVFNRRTVFHPDDLYKPKPVSNGDYSSDAQDLSEGTPRASRLEIYVKLRNKDGDELHVRVSHSISDGTTWEYEAECVGDKTLDQDIAKLKLAALKSIVQEYNIELDGPRNQSQSFIDAILNYRATLKAYIDWKPLPAEIQAQFPKPTVYRSDEAQSPEERIKSTLSDHFQNELLENHKATIANIRDEAKQKLDEQAQELVPILKIHSPDVQRISIDIDEKSFTKLDIAAVRIILRDNREINWTHIGSGKKREMSLGIFRWKHDMLTEQLEPSDEDEPSPILALYDEPDTSLDYQAQRKVTHLLNELSEYPTCQVVVATHSINLMDSVPIDTISFFDEAPLKPWKFEIGTAESELLDQMRRTLGLRNSALFNEQLMLIFEGATEITVIDFLYCAITNRMMALDGIYPVNGGDNGNALKLAKLLRTNHRRVILVLDNDCKGTPIIPGNTEAEIRHETGLTVNEHLFFVGAKELEDLFSDAQWAELFNDQYPKISGSVWNPDEISALRSETKFSEALRIILANETGYKPGKPELGRGIAQLAIKQDAIPEPLTTLIISITKQVGGD